MQQKIIEANRPLPRNEAPKTPDYVVLELRYDCQIALAPEGKFEAPVAKQKQATWLNKILESLEINRCASHFGLPAKMMAGHTSPCSMNVKVSAEFAHSGFIQIVP